MNRSLHGAAALLLTLLVAAPARGQVPLVVGSVRDQLGAPIEGAIVVGYRANGVGVTTRTDAAGTFALEGVASSPLLVTCRYCQPVRLSAKPDEPVVAIVRRYQALAEETPTTADLQSLPYGHVESAIALRPFTLLAQSTAPYPGSQLSDRGLSSTGSLTIDNGAANYDVTAGLSAYAFVPAAYEQGASVRPASDAYAYGDRAAGGIVQLAPFVTGYASNVALAGSDAIARAQIGTDAAQAAAGSFTNDEESRQRADFSASWLIGDGQSFALAGGSEQGRVFQTPGSAFAGSFSFADAAYRNAGLYNLSVDAVADRGNYIINFGDYPIASAWSDTGVTVGVHSTGAIAGFADVAVRASSGFYDAEAPYDAAPRIGGTLTQTRADAGLEARGNDYSVTAGIGTFWIDYAGGTEGVSYPSHMTLTEPSVRALLFPDRKWSVTLEDSGSFTLPTFLEQYGSVAAGPAPIAYQRNALAAAAITYTDASRVRVSFENASQSVQGSAGGSVVSTGVSATWQIAPFVALRAWTMHVSDNVELSGIVPPYGGIAPTVDAMWLTYDTGSLLRVDAVYRRDLLDSAPFYHVDGAISGPFARGLRWYAGAYDSMHRTFVDAGLRFTAR